MLPGPALTTLSKTKDFNLSVQRLWVLIHAASSKLSSIFVISNSIKTIAPHSFSPVLSDQTFKHVLLVNHIHHPSLSTQLLFKSTIFTMNGNNTNVNFYNSGNMAYSANPQINHYTADPGYDIQTIGGQNIQAQNIPSDNVGYAANPQVANYMTDNGYGIYQDAQNGAFQSSQAHNIVTANNHAQNGGSAVIGPAYMAQPAQQVHQPQQTYEQYVAEVKRNLKTKHTENAINNVFGSLDEALQYEEAMTDASEKKSKTPPACHIPQTLAEKRAKVDELIEAIKNCRSYIDKPQWKGNTYEKGSTQYERVKKEMDDAKISLLAWHVYDYAEKAYTGQLRPIPSWRYRESRAEFYWCFEDLWYNIKEACLRSKAVVMDLTGEENRNAFVRGPRFYLQRKDNNNSSNQKKASLIELGTKVEKNETPPTRGRPEPDPARFPGYKPNRNGELFTRLIEEGQMRDENGDIVAAYARDPDHAVPNDHAAQMARSWDQPDGQDSDGDDEQVQGVQQGPAPGMGQGQVQQSVQVQDNGQMHGQPQPNPVQLNGNGYVQAQTVTTNHVPQPVTPPRQPQGQKRRAEEDEEIMQSQSKRARSDNGAAGPSPSQPWKRTGSPLEQMFTNLPAVNLPNSKRPRDSGVGLDSFVGPVDQSPYQTHGSSPHTSASASASNGASSQLPPVPSSSDGLQAMHQPGGD